MKTKVIAYYLPQYHEIPENNEWWGKGFTEWTNVKNAKPVYKGHLQPRVPKNNNYYDLLDMKTVEWQTDLAKKYGIYGFCYFHYYFKDGKKLLEKPAENLLKWKNINQKFCFFWANQRWQRTWGSTKVPGTTWVSNDQKSFGDNKEVLIDQDYGDEKEWIEHFNYCLPFFKDERYIKVNNKPFFAIYVTKEIQKLKEMITLWNSLAIEEAFDGIHFVSVNDNSYMPEYFDAALQYGGGTFTKNVMYRIIKKTRNIVNRIFSLKIKDIWNYSFIWNCILHTKPYKNIKTYPGAEVQYDETPRRGQKALVFKNSNPQIFQKNMIRQLRRADTIYNSEFLFLDAWNEWGEGNYLEPDEKFGYEYLEALKKALNSD